MQKVESNFKLKSKRNHGFTLIEVIAVIAIICILAVALLPKFNGYIIQAKKVAVVDQCRKVVMAAEAYNMKAKTQLQETSEVSSIKSAAKEYLDGEVLDKVPDSTKLSECRTVVSGGDFNIDSEGKYSTVVSTEK